MENLTKMTSQTWPYERIRDKTKFGLVKKHFSFGFESLGLQLREKKEEFVILLHVIKDFGDQEEE